MGPVPARPTRVHLAIRVLVVVHVVVGLLAVAGGIALCVVHTDAPEPGQDPATDSLGVLLGVLAIVTGLVQLVPAAVALRVRRPVARLVAALLTGLVGLVLVPALTTVVPSEAGLPVLVLRALPLVLVVLAVVALVRSRNDPPAPRLTR